jgi:hypothetical protein
MKELTQDRLKEALHYDSENGSWTWLIQTSRSQTKPGDKAGRINKTWGRLEIMIDQKRYSASRLAWFYMTGEWPSAEVDHSDNNKLNNRWSNLRLASRSQNERNKSLTSRNKSGFKGVSWDPLRGKWKAQIGLPTGNKFLGRFDCPKKAHAAYCAAVEALSCDFARVS